MSACVQEVKSSVRIRIDSMRTKPKMASVSANRLNFKLIGKEWTAKVGRVARCTIAM